MKARQSKAAKVIFSKESNGRTVLREIHKVSKENSQIVTKISVDKKQRLIKEL